MSLTTDKTHIQASMQDTFMDRCTDFLYTLSRNFFVRCWKGSLGRWKWNISWHKWTRRMSLVL